MSTINLRKPLYAQAYRGFESLSLHQRLTHWYCLFI